MNSFSQSTTIQMETSTAVDWDSIYAKVNGTAFIYVTMITCFLGVIGNVITIWILQAESRFHKPLYVILTGICITDIICCGVFIPFESFQTYYIIVLRYYLGDEHTCSYEAPGYAVFFTASVYGQLTLALNRFAAVYFPFKTKLFWTNKNALLLWFILSIVYPVFYFVIGIFGGWIYYTRSDLFGDCNNKEYHPIVRWIRVITSIYFPIAVTNLMYILVFIRIMIASSTMRQSMRKRARGSVTMFVCVFVYTLCVIPHFVNIATDATNVAGNMEIKLWIKYMFRSNYAINPLFYFLFNSTLRKEYLIFIPKYVLCRKNMKKSANSSKSQSVG